MTLWWLFMRGQVCRTLSAPLSTTLIKVSQCYDQGRSETGCGRGVPGLAETCRMALKLCQFWRRNICHTYVVLIWSSWGLAYSAPESFHFQHLSYYIDGFPHFPPRFYFHIGNRVDNQKCFIPFLVHQWEDGKWSHSCSFLCRIDF